MDLTSIYWVPVLVAAILGGSVTFPASGRPIGSGPPWTSRQRMGVRLAAAGLIATLLGLWVWVTSVEEGDQSLGTVVFLLGSAVAFVGLQLVAGPLRDRRRN